MAACKTAYHVKEGHSSPESCPEYIDKLRICVHCTGPECQINSLNNGCSTFAAGGEVDRYTSSLSKILSQHQKLHVTANQAISSRTCRTYTTKIVTPGGVETKYGPCLGGGECYRSNDERADSVLCTEDGKVKTMKCCPRSFKGSYKWVLGDSCSQFKTVKYTCAASGSAFGCPAAEERAGSAMSACLVAQAKACANDGGIPTTVSPQLVTTTDGTFGCSVVLDQFVSCDDML
jgi:hypothetical protein